MQEVKKNEEEVDEHVKIVIKEPMCVKYVRKLI